MRRASERPGLTRTDATAIALGAALWLAGLAIWRLAPGLDVALLGAVAATRGSDLAAAARWLTALGEFGPLLAATLIAAGWLLSRGDARAAIWLLAVTLAGRAATTLEKDVVARARPPLAGRLVEANSASFPSAHAFNTMLVGLAIVLALRGGRGALIAAVAFSLAVGATRAVLAVHWPSDLVAGWGSALAWALASRPLLAARAVRAPGPSR